MSRATPDDQLKFLLSCVRHSNNGKVDFVEVAKECGVVSKGAAAKRYERLLKANGIHPNGGSTEILPRKSTAPSKQKSREAPEKAGATKKRKIDHDIPSLTAKPELKNYNVKSTGMLANPEPRNNFPGAGQAFRGGLPSFGVAHQGMPMGTTPSFFSRQFPVHTDAHQGQRMSFQHFRGRGAAGLDQLPVEMSFSSPLANPAIRHPVTYGFEHCNDEDRNLEQYLDTSMFLQEPMMQSIQFQPPLVNDSFPTREPQPPQEVQPMVQSSGVLSSSQGNPQKASGNIVIVD